MKTQLTHSIFFLACLSILFACTHKNTPDEQSATAEKKQIALKDSVLNEELLAFENMKHDLIGIWVSAEYENLLRSMRSLTNAANNVKYYTDIVYDGNKYVHCTMPSYMEQDLLVIQEDSTVVNPEGKVIFKILHLDGKKMKIKFTAAQTNTYKKLFEKVDSDKMYLEITKGSNSIEQEWLSGQYEVDIEGNSMFIDWKKNGRIDSDNQLKEIKHFSYMDHDMMQFQYLNDSIQTFIFNFEKDSLISLEGIDNLEELDAPINRNGIVGEMKKSRKVPLN